MKVVIARLIRLYLDVLPPSGRLHQTLEADDQHALDPFVLFKTGDSRADTVGHLYPFEDGM